MCNIYLLNIAPKVRITPKKNFLNPEKSSITVVAKTEVQLTCSTDLEDGVITWTFNNITKVYNSSNLNYLLIKKLSYLEKNIRQVL